MSSYELFLSTGGNRRGNVTLDVFEEPVVGSVDCSGVGECLVDGSVGIIAFGNGICEDLEVSQSVTLISRCLI